MAITTRRLVESHPFFEGSRIAFNSSANLSPSDRTSLTTIINLYEILSVLFTKINPKSKLGDLKHYRPSDADLDNYREIAIEFFCKLSSAFPPLGKFFSTDDYSSIVRKFRTESGGNILFRPIGLVIISEAISALMKGREIDEAFDLISTARLDLSSPPFRDVLWSPKGGMTSRKALARDLLLHSLDPSLLAKKRQKDVGSQYAVALGRDPRDWESALATLE